MFRDERRSGDQAGDFELLGAAGEDKAAGAGLVGDFQDGARMSFADAFQSLLQAIDVIGNGAENTDLAFGGRFSNGDGDGVFVDIQAEV